MSSPLCLPQTIRQLGNDIEKMLMKIHSGEIVTKLYLQLQEVLKRVSSSSLPTCSPCKDMGCPRGCVPGDTLLVPSVPCHGMGTPVGDMLCLPVCQELVYLPQYLNLLCGMTVMYHEELTAQNNLKANDSIKVR